YEVEVQARPLSGEDCFHIRPVTLAIGETFVNNQVFGRTGPQRGILGQRPERTASDRALFERKRPKRDVHRNTSNVDQQQYTAAERHLDCARRPQLEVFQPLVDVMLLIAETGEEREVHVSGESDLTPALNRDAAYDAKLPGSRLAEPLHAERRLIKLVHPRNRW